eukprot:scaffold30600_cov115-Isochrysis_galbana.AAC.3
MLCHGLTPCWARSPGGGRAPPPDSGGSAEPPCPCGLGERRWRRAGWALGLGGGGLACPRPGRASGVGRHVLVGGVNVTGFTGRESKPGSAGNSTYNAIPAGEPEKQLRARVE